MYEVFTKEGSTCGVFSTLDGAMKHAKIMNQFVTIKGTNCEICGVFGVAPPPADYEWSKEYRIGARKSKKVWIREDSEI